MLKNSLPGKNIKISSLGGQKECYKKWLRWKKGIT